MILIPKIPILPSIPSIPFVPLIPCEAHLTFHLSLFTFHFSLFTFHLLPLAREERHGVNAVGVVAKGGVLGTAEGDEATEGKVGGEGVEVRDYALHILGVCRKPALYVAKRRVGM